MEKKKIKYRQSTIYDFCTSVIDCTYAEKRVKKIRLKFTRKPKIQRSLF